LVKFILSNPIPFIPFPLIRGRGIGYVREAKPLFNSLLAFSPSKGKIISLEGSPEATLSTVAPLKLP